jgi:hypothetical protein
MPESTSIDEHCPSEPTMSNVIASRIASLAAAVAVTASLFLGVSGIAHASAQSAAAVAALGAVPANLA